MDVDKQTEPISNIDQITHLASNIMSLGDTDIYSKTYEELVRSIRSSGRVDPSWIPPSPTSHTSTNGCTRRSKSRH